MLIPTLNECDLVEGVLAGLVVLEQGIEHLGKQQFRKTSTWTCVYQVNIRSNFIQVVYNLHWSLLLMKIPPK